MKKNGKFFAGAVFGLSLLFAASVSVQAEETDTIAEGVYIGNIYVGGMTEEQAALAVERYVAELSDTKLTLTAGEQSTIVSAEDLGLEFSDMSVIEAAMDVTRGGNLIKRYKDIKDLENGDKVIDLHLSIDNTQVESLLEEKSDELNQKAVDNRVKRQSGTFVFVEGEQGIEINVKASAAAIEAFVQNGWDGTTQEIELAAELTEPRGTKEELAGIQDLLGGYHTNFKDSSSSRCTNIELAAGFIDGTILYPGDEFSVADVIGPLDASKGYELAGAYENGQTVQSYGGGVCQVSTTLYNAVILAELEVTERFNHSMTVGYVELSKDAAIAGDYKDLCFVNNWDTPIYLEGYTVGKELYFNIYGQETRPKNRVVTYESETVSTQAPVTQFVATGDPFGYVGVAQSGRTGYVARLWKVVTVNGVEESREVVNKSTYKSTPRTVRVGTATEDVNAAAVIGAAIAAGDEGAIYAAIAAYTAPAVSEAPVDEVVE